MYYGRGGPHLITFLIITTGECVDPLISGLYASSFLASSRYNFLYSANFAKLYGELTVILNGWKLFNNSIWYVTTE